MNPIRFKNISVKENFNGRGCSKIKNVLKQK
jgi:hypothetical protein